MPEIAERERKVVSVGCVRFSLFSLLGAGCAHAGCSGLFFGGRQLFGAVLLGTRPEEMALFIPS